MNKKKQNIAIIGAGAGGLLVQEILKNNNKYNIVGFIDNLKKKKKINGLKILGNNLIIPKLKSLNIHSAVISVGNTTTRTKLRNICQKNKINLASAISKETIIGRHVKLGDGCVILPGCVIFDNITIGINNWIGIGAKIAHDVKIGNDCMIGGGSMLGAHTNIKNQVLIGWGSTIGLYLTISNKVTVGFGSNVVKDVLSKKIVTGNPAK